MERNEKIDWARAGEYLLLPLRPWTLPDVAATARTSTAIWVSVVTLVLGAGLVISAEVTAGGEPFHDLADYIGELFGFALVFGVVMSPILTPVYLLVAIAGATSGSPHQSWRTRVMARVVLLNHLPLLLPLLLWAVLCALARVAHPWFGLLSGKPDWIDDPRLAALGSWWAGLALLALYALGLYLGWRSVRRMDEPGGTGRPEREPPRRGLRAGLSTAGWTLAVAGSSITVLLSIFAPDGTWALTTLGASILGALAGFGLLIYVGGRRGGRRALL